MVLMVSAAVMVMTLTSGCSPPARLHDRQAVYAGFTLLEVLLVLGIISLASLLLIPRIGSLEARTFSVQVGEVVNLLNHVRREAILRGRPGRLRLIAEDTNATLQADGPEVLASWHSGELGLRFLDSTDRRIEVEGSIDITFFPAGGSTGGTLLLAQGPQQARISIDPFSGRISHGMETDQNR